MAIRHVADALELVLPPNLKIVAVTYANSANDEDNVVALGIPHVAGRSGYSERRAQELTRELERLGILTRTSFEDLPASALSRLRSIPRRYRPTPYLFDGRPDGLDRLADRGRGAQSSHPSEQEVRPRGATGATARDQEVRPAAPKPEEEPEPNRWASSIRYDPPTSDAEPSTTPHVWIVPTANGDRRSLDVLWDTLLDVLELDSGQLTEDARGALNRALRQLREVNADPIEVRRRAARYRSGDGPVPAGAKLTASALVKHWPGLGQPAEPPTEQDELRRSGLCPPHLPDDFPDPVMGEYCVRCRTWTVDRGEPWNPVPDPTEEVPAK